MNTSIANDKVTLQLLRQNKKILHSSLVSKKYGHALKALDTYKKLHKQIMQHNEFIEQVKQLDIEDVPIECLQKWLGQFQEFSDSSPP